MLNVFFFMDVLLQTTSTPAVCAWALLLILTRDPPARFLALFESPEVVVVPETPSVLEFLTFLRYSVIIPAPRTTIAGPLIQLLQANI